MTRESLIILLPAFLTGLLVLSTHVPLGRIVLDRGIVFIDLAIAQVAGLGVVAASFFGWEQQFWTVQASAVAAALAAAAFLMWSEHRFGALQEAVIGVLFAASACVEILLLASNPHGAEHLKDLLVGQILWVSPRDLLPVAILYVAVLAIWARIDLRARPGAFYGVFAVTITASVQLVGVFLVFASLIVPALAARAVAARRPLVHGYAVGLAGYVVGLFASAALDLPTGAAVVCALVAVAIVAISTATFIRVPGRTQ
jgi:zinc/manganese transport system permease protein